MRRKTLIAASVFTLFAVSVGTVMAYFSFIKRTPLGGFETALTDVIVSAVEVDGQNIIPGGTQQFLYTIENVGTVPVNVKSQLETMWSDPLLDPNTVTGVSLAVDMGSGFQTVYDSPFALDGEFFFSEFGMEDALWELSPGQSWTVQVETMLDESVGLEYMMQSFNVEAVIAVKETGDQVPWPLN